jgi:hypothetical protein
LETSAEHTRPNYCIGARSVCAASGGILAIATTTDWQLEQHVIGGSGPTNRSFGALSHHLDIVVAIEPFAYREVLTSELPRRRPNLRILTVDPDNLESTVVRLTPLLVICTRLSVMVRHYATDVLVLYPDGENRAILFIDEQQQVWPTPDFADLLIAVDVATRRD